jgi:acyl-CoA dehydrogenase
VHRQSVARYILRDYRPPEGIWPREHIPTRREQAHAKFAHMLETLTADL